MKKRIVIFASGSGTNAENIIKYFAENKKAGVVMVLSNKKEAKVIERAQKNGVEALFFNKEELHSPDGILKILKEIEPYLIVLAGFMLKFPDIILKEFPNQVINIHPALLPNFGGKGMYGDNVHKAVIANKEIKTGITIHYVNNNYDEGTIIFQKSFPLSERDTFETVIKKIQILEQTYFPKVIEELLISEEE